MFLIFKSTKRRKYILTYCTKFFREMGRRNYLGHRMKILGESSFEVERELEREREKER